MKRIRDHEKLRRHHARVWRRIVESRARSPRGGGTGRALEADSESLIPSAHRRQQIASWAATRIVAPRVFSVVREPEAMARFVDALKHSLEESRGVSVDLENVEAIEYDGLVVLLAVLVHFKAKRVPFQGNYPRSRNARRVLDESKFFDHLLPNSRRFQEAPDYALRSSGSIVTHASMIVDSDLGAELVGEASRTVWGEPRRCPGVQLTFLELMQNTNNHASGRQTGDKHWWLSLKHHRAEKRVEFSFIDFGVGVFGSLRLKRPGERFYGMLEQLLDRVRHGNEAAVLRLVLEGELHKTTTKAYYRGKGLPAIHKALVEHRIANLAIVTNNVYFNSATAESRTISPEFPGTFIYWELLESNHSLPHVSENRERV